MQSITKEEKRLFDIAEEPPADIAICADCGWRGYTSECETELEGDWESGYYSIHLCSKCEDGGCVDSYDRSPENLKEWEIWFDKIDGD